MFVEVFSKLRLVKREKADNVMAFANVVIKIRYDVKHLAFIFKKKDKIYFKLYHEYSISELLNRKLF